MSDQDIQKYEKMLEEDPHSRAFAPLAEAYRKAGNLEDAIRVAEAGLEIHPGYAGGLVVLGRAYYERKELDKAVEILKKAVKETPESYLGQKFLGKALVDKGENQEALQALEAAQMLSPGDGEVVELLEQTRPKAQPPEAMTFEDSGRDENSESAGIVTYEQKPTTVDGVELEPLSLTTVDETFNFSGIQGDEFSPPEIAGEAGEAKVNEKDALDDLGPDAASFIEEADDIDVAVFNVSEEEIDQEEDSFNIEDLIEEVSSEPDQTAENHSPEEIRQPPVTQRTEPAAPDANHQEFPPRQVAVSAGQAEQDEQIVPSPAYETESTAHFMEEGGPDITPVPQPEPQEMPEPERVAGPAAEGIVGVSATQSLDPAAGGTTSSPTEPKAGGHPAEPSSSVPVSDQMSETNESEPGQSASGGEISTETLADLYARQGLVEKAAEIYRQILLERPGDEGVMIKLEELEKSAGPPPQADPTPVSLSQAQGKPSDGTDDILNVLENWLENAERMKRQ